MHNRIETVVTVVNAEQGIHGLAIVGEIDPSESGAAFADHVEGMDVISGVEETLDHGAT